MTLKSRWKNYPLWLKGGLIFPPIAILLIILLIFLSNAFPTIFAILNKGSLTFWGYIIFVLAGPFLVPMIITVRSIFGGGSISQYANLILIVALLLNLLWLFGIGAMFGQLIRKITKKAQPIKKQHPQKSHAKKLSGKKS